jgi:hypothetical protein
MTTFHCLIWYSPNLEGQVPVFISSRNRVAQLYPRAQGSLLSPLRWSYSIPPHTGFLYEVKVTLQSTVSRPVLVSGTHLGPATNFSHSLFDFFFFTVSDLLMWGALSDEKSGLYFSVFACHSQRSLSQIWVPRDSWAYFIVSIFETPTFYIKILLVFQVFYPDQIEKVESYYGNTESCFVHVLHLRLLRRCQTFLYISHVRLRPPLWSGGQSSWLQIRKYVFDSQHYHEKK